MLASSSHSYYKAPECLLTAAAGRYSRFRVNVSVPGGMEIGILQDEGAHCASHELECVVVKDARLGTAGCG